MPEVHPGAALAAGYPADAGSAAIAPEHAQPSCRSHPVIPVSGGGGDRFPGAGSTIAAPSSSDHRGVGNVADITIIATLDRGAGRIAGLAASLASQTQEEFELVCVGSARDVEEFQEAASEAGHPCTPVECDGDAAAMRTAGLAAATRGYILFVSNFMRFASGLVEILSQAIDDGGIGNVDVYAFHMQALDSSSGEYLTKAYAMRRQSSIAFAPSEQSDQIFQCYGSNLGGMLISRAHLQALGMGFSCENPIDDEPVAMLALCKARKAVYIKWPMTALVYDRKSFLQSMLASQLEKRLDIAAGMSSCFSGQDGGEGEGAAGGQAPESASTGADGDSAGAAASIAGMDMHPFVRSYLEWLVAFAVDGIRDQPSGMRERLIDAIGEKVSPVVASLRQEGMKLGDWEKLRTVELCGLDRMSLIDAHIESERALSEKVFDTEFEALRYAREHEPGRDRLKRRWRKLFGA